jgi:SAM-dependent methyltransferase
MEVYDAAPVSIITGETDSYDKDIFPKVIRRKEISLIKSLLQTVKPHLILDYGCGGGWLTLLMRNWGYNSVGVDISKNMLKAAKIVCPANDFVLCDATRLPFVTNNFDFVVGISILHHLHFKRATDELKRISVPSSTFVFMEPNLLNPLSAFGRRFFPMDAHTKGEKPFMPESFRSALSLANFDIQSFFTNFFVSFPLARTAKITHFHSPSFLVLGIYTLENLAEKLPFFRYLNSNIVAIVKSSNR